MTSNSAPPPGDLGEDGEFVGALTFLQNNGIINENGSSFLTRIAAEAFFEATRSCQGAGFAGQIIQLECNPPSLNGRSISDNRNCVYCRQIKQQAYTMRTQLEQEASQLSQGAYQAQSLDANLRQQIDSDNIGLDPCRYVCAACVLEDTDQVERLRFSATCNFNDPDFNSRFVAVMQNTIVQQVQTVKQYLTTLNVTTIPSTIAEQLSQKINLQLTSSVREDIMASVRAYQSISFQPGSYSILASGNSQVFSVKVAFQFFERQRLQAKIYDSTKYNTFVSALKSKTSSKDLRKDIRKAIRSLSDMWKTIEGKIIMILITIFLILLVGMIAYLEVMRTRT